MITLCRKPGCYLTCSHPWPCGVGTGGSEPLSQQAMVLVGRGHSETAWPDLAGGHLAFFLSFCFLIPRVPHFAQRAIIDNWSVLALSSPPPCILTTVLVWLVGKVGSGGLSGLWVWLSHQV